jgi:hypothetical protein
MTLCSFCEKKAEVDRSINYPRTGEVHHCEKHYREFGKPEEGVGLTKPQIDELISVLKDWQSSKMAWKDSDEYVKGFKEAIRIALANIYKLTAVEEIEASDE